MSFCQVQNAILALSCFTPESVFKNGRCLDHLLVNKAAGLASKNDNSRRWGHVAFGRLLGSKGHMSHMEMATDCHRVFRLPSLTGEAPWLQSPGFRRWCPACSTTLLRAGVWCGTEIRIFMLDPSPTKGFRTNISTSFRKDVSRCWKQLLFIQGNWQGSQTELGKNMPMPLSRRHSKQGLDMSISCHATCLLRFFLSTAKKLAKLMENGEIHRHSNEAAPAVLPGPCSTTLSLHTVFGSYWIPFISVAFLCHENLDFWCTSAI